MSQRTKESAKLALVQAASALLKEALQGRGNLSREDLEYLVEKTATLKDDRLKQCVAELIGWGDDQRAHLETMVAIGIELMKIASPQKVVEAAKRVELRYHMKVLKEGEV
jgi:hypothetical protein